MKKIVFVIDAFENYNDWASEDKKIHAKIAALIKDIWRNPFSGSANPNL